MRTPRILTIPYGPSPSQVGELHLPDAERPPVVGLLHGGFWRLPYGREQMGPVAEDLAGRGFAAWNIGYRRVGEPGGGWPGTLEDIEAALGALRDPALSLDLRRVTLVGHSAGGHLALWAAGRVRIAGLSIVGAVGQAAVSDLARAHALDLGRGAVTGFLGDMARCTMASPAELLPLGVPQLLLHGTEDDAVPLAMSEAYVRSAREAGDAAQLEVLPGAGHMDFLDPRSAAHEALCRWLGR